MGRQIEQLRTTVATAIADHKAYEVPALCTSLGLAEGTETEAFSSKYQYALKRLRGHSGADLVEIARTLLDSRDNFEMAELVAKVTDFGASAVTELTRKRIAAVFNGAPLCTEMEDIDLIRRVWPIATMPSPFHATAFSEETLEDAIFQHTVRNDDWTQQELLQFLGIMNCSQEHLFRFLEAVTDPLAQSAERQQRLATAINQHLAHDGFVLAVAGRISGSPKYQVRRLAKGVPSDAEITATLGAFSPEDISDRWRAALERRSTDPAGAITLSRTLLEDVCKWVLTEAAVPYGDKDELPTLYKKLAGVLNLAPDAHTEQVFKQILGNAQSIVESLGALRNKLGDAHSGGPKKAKPQPRHAELSVNLAGTMATFLVATWRARQDNVSGGVAS